MTRTFVPLRRIAALSVAITLFATPIAAAQSPESAPPISAPANTVLLSSAAFARLIQVPPDPPRLDLFRQATAVMARQAQPAPTKAPERSWASRHKWAIIVPAVFGGVILGFFARCLVGSPPNYCE
jgi:hypothetical protein